MRRSLVVKTLQGQDTFYDVPEQREHDASIEANVLTIYTRKIGPDHVKVPLTIYAGGYWLKYWIELTAE